MQVDHGPLRSQSTLDRYLGLDIALRNMLEYMGNQAKEIRELTNVDPRIEQYRPDRDPIYSIHRPFWKGMFKYKRVTLSFFSDIAI
jgi:hypothetical protein